MRILIPIIAILITLCACTHKSATIKVVPTPVAIDSCDTTTVSYATRVKPIIQANCYRCHGTAVTAGGGLDLEDFTTLKNYLENGFRGDGIYGSKFYHCILHSVGALPMPPTYKLDSCNRNTISRWIHEGAPNN